MIKRAYMKPMKNAAKTFAKRAPFANRTDKEDPATYWKAVEVKGIVDRMAHYKEGSGLADPRDFFEPEVHEKGREILPEAGCIDINLFSYLADTDRSYKALAIAAQAVNTVIVLANEISDEAVIAATVDERKGDHAKMEVLYRQMERIITENDLIDLRETNSWYTYCILLIRNILLYPFTEYSNTRVAMHKYIDGNKYFEDKPYFMRKAVADAFFYFMKWSRRYAYMEELGAPDFVMNNEFLRIADCVYAIYNEPVSFLDDFEKRYGHTMEGEEVDLEDISKDYDDKTGDDTSDDTESDDAEDEENTEYDVIIPEIPEDFPRYDESGKRIDYQYDDETGEWVDMRSDREIKAAKEKGRQYEAFADKAQEIARAVSGKEYRDWKEFAEEFHSIDVLPTYVLCAHLDKTPDKDGYTKDLIQIVGDAGIFEVVVPLYATSNSEDGIKIKDLHPYSKMSKYAIRPRVFN